jgi:hypothetical protein
MVASRFTGCLTLFWAALWLHILWVAAVVLLVLWLVGFALGRGESAGTHRFYRWLPSRHLVRRSWKENEGQARELGPSSLRDPNS